MSHDRILLVLGGEEPSQGLLVVLLLQLGDLGKKTSSLRLLLVGSSAGHP